MTASQVPARLWKALWIWQRNDGPANTWICFRKQFRLGGRCASAVARIAADSKYWLWVNGRLVVREGGLRRGPKPGSGYFDQVDLARHLRRGVNTIAALIWYWGRHGFSHQDSGRGGFVFEMRARAGRSVTLVTSDRTWRALAHPAFRATKPPNYRLPEWPVRFDARLDIPGWQKPSFDDGTWPRAVEKGRPPARPWGPLEPRGVPFWKDYGLKKFTRLPRLRKGVCALDLPYDMQLEPWLRVDAPAGKTIRMTTDHSSLGPLDWTYVTRRGVQEWESPGWINGQQLRFRVPRGVKLLAAGYRETGVNADFAGAFRCEDERLNLLWEKARRTTYVCLRDTYMDCPDRERAQWWGDAVNELPQTFYGFAPAAYAHARKGVLEIARWQRKDGTLYAPVPSGNFDQELPCQMLAGAWVMWQYYLFTGDREAVEIVYPHVRRYLLDVWRKRKDAAGFVVPRGEWVWIDWGERQDGYRVANGLYVMALDAAIAMAELLGRRRDLPTLRGLRDDLAGRFDGLWTGAGFGPDDRANAVAVVAGMVRDDQREAVTRLLKTVHNASPYMERFVEEALFVLGDDRAALARMRRRYKRMIDSPHSTLWELWKLGGQTSVNHAWAGGPLYLLSAYVAGVRPVEPGFRVFKVAPQLGGLREVDCTVPTVNGPIKAAIRDRDEAFTIDLTCPSNCAARVGLPKLAYPYFGLKLDGRTIRPLPADPARDPRFLWVRTGPGRHSVKAGKS